MRAASYAAIRRLNRRSDHPPPRARQVRNRRSGMRVGVLAAGLRRRFSVRFSSGSSWSRVGSGCT